ncbi:spexin prohormone 2-like [Melanotaenia boesemani]|uniref:spexin prohormone 2-like n=1 Tax=Melanotaenia boesemani TaxID=1250792 RepID=UPI001C059EEF|nr:spexin prohormone 2-like [Melanotaenia boesemani]
MTVLQGDSVEKTKASVVWTCSLVLTLFVEACHAQKLKIHWGPQSMMYLKGKYGKRFVLEDHSGVLKQSLQSFYTLLRGMQALRLLRLKKRDNNMSSDKVLVHCLQER